MEVEPDYERFVSLSPELHCVADTQGRFLWLNDAWESALGWSHQELLSTPFLQRVHPEDRDSTEREVNRLATGLPTLQFRNRYQRRDGEWRWFEWTARLEGELIYGTARDVTVLEHGSAADRRRVQLLELAERISQTGHWRFDVVDKTLYWSPQVYRIHGRDPQGPGPSLAEGVDAYHLDDQHMVAALMNRAIETGHGFEFFSRLVRADGEIRKVHSIGRPEFRDGTREVVAIFGVFRDVTEDAQLREVNEKLEEFNYLASHDLVEPLRTIEGHLGLLEELAGDSLDAEARRFLGFAVGASVRAQALIRDLLTYCRLGQRGEPCHVPLAPLCASVIDDLQARVEAEGATVRVEPLPTVIGTETALRQIMSNLVANALKFHRPGVPPVVEITMAEAPGEWQLAVHDNGLGIEARHLQRIFQPFQSLQPRTDSDGGTGIGLSIVRRAVQQLGGTIGVESTPGQGSTFRFTLPRGS